MPRPAQMGGGFEDQSLGGCLINGILLIMFVILFFTFAGVHV